MMDLLKEKGLSRHITSEELREDFEAALRGEVPQDLGLRFLARDLFE